MKQAHIDRRKKLENLLIKAVKKCEVCDKKKDLEGHTVYKRSQTETLAPRARNVLVVCSECHNHEFWGTGIELNYEEAMGIIAARNVEKKIDPEIG